MLDRTFIAAKNAGVGFNVATIPANFNAPSRGPFDPNYMKALFDVGFEQGKSAAAFAAAPPPYPGAAGSRLERHCQTSDHRQCTTGSDQMRKAGRRCYGNRLRALVAIAATPSDAGAKTHVAIARL